MEYSYFISPEGQDDNPGTKEYPFRTIEKARDAIRENKTKMTAAGDVTVYLRGGTYPITNAIKFNEKDSGDNGHFIIYRNYPGEVPVICGGVHLTGWKPSSKNNVKGLWECDAGEIQNTRQMFVNGQRWARARSKAVFTGAWQVYDDPGMRFHDLIEEYVTFQGRKPVYAGYLTTNADLLNWENKKDIEFVYDVGWSHSICPVDDIRRVGDQIFVQMRMPCFRDCQIKGGVQIGSPNYIENAFELLDTPGEWYFDRAKRVMYCIPPENVDLTDCEVIVPVAEQLLNIKGQLDEPVHHLRVEGIVFEYTTWLRPGIEGHPEVQANLLKDPAENFLLHSCYLKVTSAVVIDAAKDVGLVGCIFRKIGSGALDIQNGSQDIFISRNQIHNISGSGIQIGDFNLNDAHPDDERKIVRNIVVQNNHIYDIGTEYKGSIGINAGFVQDTDILHNEIHDVAYSGISVGWGWGYWDPDTEKRTKFPISDYPTYSSGTVSKRNRIEYNHVHHVVMKLHDGGGIYIISLQPDSTISGNCVHDNGGYQEKMCLEEVLDSETGEKRLKEIAGYKGFPGGIYLDQASGGFTISENIVYGVPVAFFYHDIGIPGRYESNKLHDNYFNDPSARGSYGLEDLKP